MRNEYEYFTVIHPNNPERWERIDVKDVSTICQVDIKTAKRWITGSQCPHPSAQRLLQIYAFGEIPLINPASFSNMRFKKRGYGHKSDKPVMVIDGWRGDMELTASDLVFYTQKLTHDMIAIQKLETQCTELKKEIEKLERPNNNVVAFAPFLRRKEYYSDQQA